jgi:outer membrane receptor protein involved in Fe transport
MQAIVGHTIEKSKESYGEGQFVKTDEERLNFRFNYQIDWFTDHTLVLGTDLQKTQFDYSFDVIPYYCTDHDPDCESKKGERIQDIDKLNDQTLALYMNDIWRINEDWQFILGFRGEENDYTGQSFLHHRLALQWQATDDLTFKIKQGSYSRFPDVETVLRKVGNPSLKSPKAQHYSVGLDYQLNDKWQTSFDVYYKDLGNLPRSIDEGDVNAHLHYSNDMSGTAKGVEWVITRELADDWYGWASISWSESERTDDYTQTTTEYYLDTPLLGNFVANYQLNERWNFGVRLTIRSGQKYTPIVGLRENPDYPEYYLPTYGELNSKTLPTYHRLDIQANYNTKYWGNDAQWTFAILNALGSDNISGYYYAPDGNETLTSYNIEGEEGMEMFPSIGLKMQF